MVKTPEEYFTDHAFAPADTGGTNMTPAEQAFLQKYVGVEGAKAMGIDMPAAAVISSEEAAPPAPPLVDELKNAHSMQMIFFYLGNQIYTIPIAAVQEVIRYVTPTSLPLAPPYVAGVMNLRGRITPMLYLDQLLCSASEQNQESGFIIICMRHGLQVGLIVKSIHNMYTIEQKQVIWNVESQIGANTDYLCGIIDFNDKVYGIVSIDMIVDHVIQS